MSESNAGDAPAEAEARLAEIVARFGATLSPRQLEQIRSRIERTLSLSAAMRATPLTNADEPEIVFAPYRSEA
jgi:hypothetical protein